MPPDALAATYPVISQASVAGAPALDPSRSHAYNRAMEPRINFVTLVVADLERARRFYLHGLGWPAALEASGEVTMIHAGARLVLSLWAEQAARAEIGEVTRGGTLPFTLSHNVATPAEVDAALAAARAAGATVHAAQQRDWGGYSGYFVDPDGFRWEVAHNPHPIGDVTLP
jgi:catechol 2,3-dioxygenase-like lactoylglutathione lyase family enzyme